MVPVNVSWGSGHRLFGNNSHLGPQGALVPRAAPAQGAARRENHPAGETRGPSSGPRCPVPTPRANRTQQTDARPGGVGLGGSEPGSKSQSPSKAVRNAPRRAARSLRDPPLDSHIQGRIGGKKFPQRPWRACRVGATDLLSPVVVVVNSHSVSARSTNPHTPAPGPVFIPRLWDTSALAPKI